LADLEPIAGPSRRRAPPIRVYALLVFASLFVLGLAQAAWSLRLEILGTINTGEAALNFVGSFTDDDGLANDPLLDPDDGGNCSLGGRAESSCDPTSIGPGPKPRLDRDVARCAASADPEGLVAIVELSEAYPDYRCTAWFVMDNTGSLPLRITGLKLNESPTDLPSQTSADLNGDGEPDLTLDLRGVEACQQLDPGQQGILELGQHVLGAAPPGAALHFTVQVEFQQWNAPCPVTASGP
jgi:hypothetical protein